jgi:hypothetical protein
LLQHRSPFRDRVAEIGDCFFQGIYLSLLLLSHSIFGRALCVLGGLVPLGVVENSLRKQVCACQQHYRQHYKRG